ncbi:MAG: hypothetical protein HYW07_07435 [Candidatus Latescibacteria bacterium]|nr:hypothetical protein [Candidatus Latescibacterota bacterium]
MSARPSISRTIFCDRSPLATEVITRPISVVGCTRSVISMLTESTLVAQPPAAPPRVARCEIRPSLPTTVLTRSNSPAIRSFRSMMSLRVS